MDIDGLIIDLHRRYSALKYGYVSPHDEIPRSMPAIRSPTIPGADELDSEGVEAKEGRYRGL